jgi:hypothetical protein
MQGRHQIKTPPSTMRLCVSRSRVNGARSRDSGARSRDSGVVQI